MNSTSVKDYLNKLHNADAFTQLAEPKQESAIFTAIETLKDNFPPHKLTDRIAALQVLYMLEGEDEEYAKLKRHGVKTYAVKGVSISFEGSDISPDVLKLMGKGQAKAKRLI